MTSSMWIKLKKTSLEITNENKARVWKHTVNCFGWEIQNFKNLLTGDSKTPQALVFASHRKSLRALGDAWRQRTRAGGGPGHFVLHSCIALQGGKPAIMENLDQELRAWVGSQSVPCISSLNRIYLPGQMWLPPLAQCFPLASPSGPKAQPLFISLLRCQDWVQAIFSMWINFPTLLSFSWFLVIHDL